QSARFFRQLDLLAKEAMPVAFGFGERAPERLLEVAREIERADRAAPLGLEDVADERAARGVGAARRLEQEGEALDALERGREVRVEHRTRPLVRRQPALRSPSRGDRDSFDDRRRRKKPAERAGDAEGPAPDVAHDDVNDLV